MAIIPMGPPQSVPIFSGFDYVTVDAEHRRVYAAHGGSNALLIVDADTGKVLRQVKVGPMHGVAFDPASGHVFTGNGDDKSVSEVDPETGKVLRSVDVGGLVDAVIIDAATHRLYADEDDGTHLYVIDTATMKLVKSVDLPGHKPEYLAVDPATHNVYQNIANTAELVTVDGTALKVIADVKTPELTNNHPLQYDPQFKQIVTGGANGVFSVYSPAGKKLFQVDGPKGVDQCDLDRESHTMACAGRGETPGSSMITVMALQANAAPKIVAQLPVHAGTHTIAIDGKTKNMWTVYASPDGSGDFVQRYSLEK